MKTNSTTNSYYYLLILVLTGCSATQQSKQRMDALEARHELAIERIIKLEERKCVEITPQWGYKLEMSTRQYYIDPQNIIPYFDRQLHPQTTEYNLPDPR